MRFLESLVGRWGLKDTKKLSRGCLEELQQSSENHHFAVISQRVSCYYYCRSNGETGPLLGMGVASLAEKLLVYCYQLFLNLSGASVPVLLAAPQATELFVRRGEHGYILSKPQTRPIIKIALFL